MKGTRRVFGDIGNSQADGDNPLSSLFKQPVAGTMKSAAFDTSKSTFQQKSLKANEVATKPKLGVQRSYKTIGTEAGNNIAAALRQPVPSTKGISGRSFRVHQGGQGGSKHASIKSFVGASGFNVIPEREGVIAKQEANETLPITDSNIKKQQYGQPPQIITKKVAKPTGLADTIYVTETDVDSVATAFSQQRLDIPEDIDAKDSTNPILVSEYINEIMGYMFALERKYPIRSRYLEGRPINSRMRAVLLDWLVEVHDQYNFTAETLYLCCKLMDRYLQADAYITRQELQLVGVTSLYLAAKYEEVYTPTMRDFVVISDNAFTVANIRQMEMRMLMTLNYDLSPPQPCFFLRRFSKAAFADVKLHALAKYIMELSLGDYSVADLFPSEVASASLALALMIQDKKTLPAVWSKTLEFYSNYTLEALRPNVYKMAQVLGRIHDEGAKLQAVKKKYSRAKAYFRISRGEDLNVVNWKERIMAELQPHEP